MTLFIIGDIWSNLLSVRCFSRLQKNVTACDDEQVEKDVFNGCG